MNPLRSFVLDMTIIFALVASTTNSVGFADGKLIANTAIAEGNCDPCVLTMYNFEQDFSNTCVKEEAMKNPIIAEVIHADSFCSHTWDAFCLVTYNDCYQQACGPTKQGLVEVVAASGGPTGRHINRTQILNECPHKHTPVPSSTFAPTETFSPTTTFAPSSTFAPSTILAATSNKNKNKGPRLSSEPARESIGKSSTIKLRDSAASAILPAANSSVLVDSMLFVIFYVLFP